MGGTTRIFCKLQVRGQCATHMRTCQDAHACSGSEEVVVALGMHACVAKPWRPLRARADSVYSSNASLPPVTYC
eukprot:6200016-Pleurochrysis_carterae.AAC.2